MFFAIDYIEAEFAAVEYNVPPAAMGHVRAAARTELATYLEHLLHSTVGIKTTCLYLRCLAWRFDELELPASDPLPAEAAKAAP